MVYALPAEETVDPAARLREVLSLVRGVEAAGNLLILRTAPGNAMPVARAFDIADLPEVAGTIGGDDTILLVAREPGSGADLADLCVQLQSPSGRDPCLTGSPCSGRRVGDLPVGRPALVGSPGRWPRPGAARLLALAARRQGALPLRRARVDRARPHARAPGTARGRRGRDARIRARRARAADRRRAGRGRAQLPRAAARRAARAARPARPRGSLAQRPGRGRDAAVGARRLPATGRPGRRAAAGARRGSARRADAGAARLHPPAARAARAARPLPRRARLGARAR